jgi:putative methyltransferase (TIGR04325 family)
MRTWGKNFKRLFRSQRRSHVVGQDIVFKGDYNSWDDAVQSSTGYDTGVILEKTCAALLKVKNGEAVYERDSVLFDKIQHSFPVLAGLLHTAQSHDGKLCVVDFGGALGSSYFQCRDFLKVVRQLEWLVVEQSAHITCGRKHFESDQLRFYNTIEECKVVHQPNALLLSSVLQYLPDPYEILQKLLSHRINHVIIDRTAFLVSGRERLTVQHVPDSIYPASYPAWFFSETKFTAAVESAGYILAADFPGTDDLSPEGEKAYFKGFIYERRGA